MTKIEWTGSTWNPITGCNKISAGCAHCYAADIAKRFWGDRPFSEVRFHEDRLSLPLKRKKPTTYFVNSMSDLFHESVTDKQLNWIFAVIALTPHHTYQILTKRPDRMRQYFADMDRSSGRPMKVAAAARSLLEKFFGMKELDREWQNYLAINRSFPLPNVWLGVTIENQKALRDRSMVLHQMNLAGWKTFYSVEPLLESVDLMLNGCPVDWVIVGGESGAQARPFMLEWARNIQSQCEKQNVPFFFKQPGANAWDGDLKLSKHAKGDKLSEIPLDLQIRQFPTIN